MPVLVTVTVTVTMLMLMVVTMIAPRSVDVRGSFHGDRHHRSRGRLRPGRFGGGRGMGVAMRMPVPSRGIRTALGLERGFEFGHDEVHLAQHVGQHVVRFERQVIDPILQANIVGTYNLYEAARKQGVRRVVFASSNHVTGFYRQDEVLTPSSPMRPDGLYGVSKAFGENLARFYFDRSAGTACAGSRR